MLPRGSGDPWPSAGCPQRSYKTSLNLIKRAYLPTGADRAQMDFGLTGRHARARNRGPGPAAVLAWLRRNGPSLLMITGASTEPILVTDRVSG